MSITLSVNKMRALLAILLLIPSLSFGKMISLEDYERQNPNMGEEEAIYITYRCSAVFYHLSKLSEQQPDLYEKLNSSQEYFTGVAMVMMSRILPNEDVSFIKKKVAITINDFINKYIEISNEHYLNTGTYLNNDILKDVEFCNKSIFPLD